MSVQIPKAVFNWSGGKDSALALYYALQNRECPVDKLLTNITIGNHRVAMHEVRHSLLQAQAQAIGIPLQTLLLPEQPSAAIYEQRVFQTLQKLHTEGFTHSIYGDIFLEDLKRYRENQVAQAGLHPVFPLWHKPSSDLIRQFLDLGFRAIVVCINADVLPKEFAGRWLDEHFIADLPAGVDECGENGEFHTFVFDGPIFSNPVQFSIGETQYREYKSPSPGSDKSAPNNEGMGFYFTDLLPF